jgi:hypothetical protein
MNRDHSRSDRNKHNIEAWTVGVALLSAVIGGTTGWFSTYVAYHSSKEHEQAETRREVQQQVAELTRQTQHDSFEALQQSKQTLLQVQRENFRPFYDRQFTIYFDGARVAATLASSTSPAERKQAEEEFWKLYWGTMAIVEDQQVASAMIDFGDALKANHAISQRENLAGPSIELAHAFRQSLYDAKWPVPGRNLRRE